MSHPSTQGNGCSLEDCHTNLFALLCRPQNVCPKPDSPDDIHSAVENENTHLLTLQTQLDGIKWRVLCARDESKICSEPLNDPVLWSFTRCIQSDVLCVWRRVRSQDHKASMVDQFGCNKVLWIFWYGREPANLSNLISPKLKELEQGCWENGLSYECRTLLFKALHNLIERCLLSQKFLRVGKWFVQPYDHCGKDHDKSCHLSIRFSFFLHGEDQVCASIDVREHPALKRLHPQHIAFAHHASPRSVQVLLAPYGLSGTLTGQTYKESDPTTQKLMQEWRQFYVVPEPHTPETAQLPVAVEVIVAGSRMRYPSSFVLITAEAEAELLRQHGHSPESLNGTLPARPMSPPLSPSLIGSTTNTGVQPPSDRDCLTPTLGNHDGVTLGHRMVEKVWQDSTVNSTIHAQSRHHAQPGDGDSTSTHQADEAAVLGSWELAEPMQKNACYCSRPKGGKRGIGRQNISSNITAPKVEKGDKTSGEKKKPTSLAYHHRMLMQEDLIRQDIELLSQPRVTPLANFAGNYTKPQTPSQGVSTPLGNSTFEAPMDSPHSAAPSPLVATPIQPSMSHNHNADPTMPTLSPHPPSKSTDKDLASSAGSSQLDSQDSASAVCVTENGRTGESTLTTVNGHAQPDDSVKQEHTPAADNTVVASVQQPVENGVPFPAVEEATPPVIPTKQIATSCPKKPQMMPSWLHSQQLKQYVAPLLPPLLPANSYEANTEELVTESLYDFDQFNSWLNHPVKKQRLDPEVFVRLGQNGQSNNNIPANGRFPAAGAGGKPNGDSDISPQRPTPDPYEFSDEASDTFPNKPQRRSRSSREGSFASVQSFKQEDEMLRNPDGSFAGIKDEFNKPTIELSRDGNAADDWKREENLKATANDLDMFDMFESDSETSDDPPRVGSPHETTIGTEDANHITALSSNPTNSETGPTQTELSRMFPTPPSLENQHNSPVASSDLPSDHMHMDSAMPANSIIANTELKHPKMIDEQNMDWSFVYKPPTHATFVSSNKYASIVLPSQKLPSVNLLSDIYYKPPSSWQGCTMPIMDKQHLASANNTSMDSMVGTPRGHDRMPGVDASPSQFPTPGSAQQRTPRTPMSYELQSPASNASSYMNTNLKSVDNLPTNSQLPEAHSLVANVMLSDSVLNLFRDHNFDSCTLCVCNLNISGGDIGVYLPDTTGEDQFSCRCGFSAVMNRRFGANSGLFYEDEVDITGMRHNQYDRRKPSLVEPDKAESILKRSLNQEQPSHIEDAPQDILCLLQQQFSLMHPSAAINHYFTSKPAVLRDQQQELISLLEMQDGCESCGAALEVGRQGMDNSPGKSEESAAHSLHKWSYVLTGAKVPTNSQDVVRLLMSLQPLLQDAIQRKPTATVWKSIYKIQGPLSWKGFHLLAGKGSRFTTAPQPIPQVVVGQDRDWVTVSPLSIGIWDKLMLEPYGKPRDVAYVIVAPDNDYILQHVLGFFKELSTTYEACRLGKHRPLSRTLRDGVLRVGKSAASKLADQQVQLEWFNLIGNSAAASKLKLYAKVCEYHLAPILTGEKPDKSLFSDPPPSRLPQSRPNTSSGTDSQNTGPGSAPSPIHNPGSQGPPSVGSPDDKEDDGGTPSHAHNRVRDQLNELEEDNSDPPAIVIYMVDPFAYGHEWADMPRLSILGLLRCYQAMFLPEDVTKNLQLQIIPLQTVLDFRKSPLSSSMISLAMSVYTQCRRVVDHEIPGRSLTGFGPAAAAELILKGDGREGVSKKAEETLCLYTPPFKLATNDKTLFDKDGKTKAGVLLCGYCLSEDQRWLLATATDNEGSLMETCTINIEIPNRNQRKKASARKVALTKLWDFILKIVSNSAQSWRLIVGRFGRIGHGELKGLAAFLSKTNLQNTNKRWQDMCTMCSVLESGEPPSIQSACLVSTELHQSIHVMPDSVKLEDRSSSSSQLTTPHDASCTHILVFPTSSMAQAAAAAGPVNPHDEDVDDFFNENLDDDFVGLPNDLGLGSDLIDIFSGIMPDMGHGGLDPDPGDHNHPSHMRQSPDDMNKAGTGSGTADLQDSAEIKLLQQPLAMGFLVSTSSPGPLPRWFWSSCPGREHHSPVCFKTALHINCSTAHQSQDEYPQHHSHDSDHPLDSTLTCDVLRYVLETYNALSWLSYDPSTNDRRSCLPAHFLLLMQLYHAMDKFV